jgi:hypothetical protein
MTTGRRRAARERQRRWRKNDREGRRVVRVAVDCRVLTWLQRHYPGACDLDDLAAVGRLISDILQSSSRSEL